MNELEVRIRNIIAEEIFGAKGPVYNLRYGEAMLIEAAARRITIALHEALKT